MKLYKLITHCSLLTTILLLSSCARMGNPDGGWYDEQPPRIIKTEPQDGSVNIKSKKINIYFDEYVKIDNASENVVICPPQIEQADVKSKGKYISVSFNDSLKAGTTYTIDFSDAITDNNESNPLGNYTYSFSTGDVIDTLQVSGTVVTAERDEFVKGIIVGLYPADEDSLMTKPFLRIGRTDANGHFVIKGIKPGTYRIYALKDMDQNYMLTPRSGEMLAMGEETITPSVFTDMRQDTVMTDSLHIKSIARVKYQHYMPDNIILRAFNEEQRERNYIKYERNEPERFVLVFSGGDKVLPELKGLNFSTADAFLIDSSEKKDSITYWLKDTALVNQDSLMVEMKYNMTDTLGNFVQGTDTLTFLPKTFFAKRQKQAKKEYDDWFKKEQKKKKKGQPYDSIMPPKELELTFKETKKFNPADSIIITSHAPLASIDTTKIHLYIDGDSLKQEQKFLFEKEPSVDIRTYKLTADWQYETKYKLVIDSTAFVDIYGKVNSRTEKKISIDRKSAFGTLNIEIPSCKGQRIIVDLIDQSEKLLKSETTENGKVSFPYVLEQDYFLRMTIDKNSDGMWTTGKYEDNLQPEEVYYYPGTIKCKGDWTITKTWSPEKSDFIRKPGQLRKNQSSKKTVSMYDKNIKRAEKLGIKLPDKYKK